MLKQLSDDNSSLGWSAREWAEHLNCSAGTVKETKVWKETMKAARSLQAAQGAARMDPSRVKPKGRRKPT